MQDPGDAPGVGKKGARSTPTVAKIELLRHRAFPNLGWVRITSSDGAAGLGETFFNIDAVFGYVREIIAPYLLGTDPSCVTLHAHQLSRLWGRSGMGAESRAGSAIDIALWDLHGYRTQQPLHQMLGGACRESIRVYNTCGGPLYASDLPLPGAGYAGDAWSSTAGASGLSDSQMEDLKRTASDPGGLARELLASGITGMKVWPFDDLAHETRGLYLTARQLDSGRAVLEAIRDAVGTEMAVMLELHGMWTPSAAKVLVHELEDLSLTWIEDPIRMSTPEALLSVSRETAVPIVASETLSGQFAFLDFLTNRSVGIVMCDPLWVGGVTETRRVADLAKAFDLPFTPHDCTGPVGLSVGVEMCYATPNAMIQEMVRAYYYGWYQQVAEGLPVLTDGHLHSTAANGHGVTLRQEFVQDCEVEVIEGV